MHNQISSNQNNIDFTKHKKAFAEKEVFYDETGTEYLPDRPPFILNSETIKSAFWYDRVFDLPNLDKEILKDIQYQLKSLDKLICLQDYVADFSSPEEKVAKFIELILTTRKADFEDIVIDAMYKLQNNEIFCKSTKASSKYAGSYCGVEKENNYICTGLRDVENYLEISKYLDLSDGSKVEDLYSRTTKILNKATNKYETRKPGQPKSKFIKTYKSTYDRFTHEISEIISGVYFKLKSASVRETTEDFNCFVIDSDSEYKNIYVAIIAMALFLNWAKALLGLEEDLPFPTYIVYNPKSKHTQFAFEFTYPIRFKSWQDSAKTYFYEISRSLSLLYSIFWKLLDLDYTGDLNFKNLAAKNVFHDSQCTVYTGKYIDTSTFNIHQYSYDTFEFEAPRDFKNFERLRSFYIYYNGYRQSVKNSENADQKLAEHYKSFVEQIKDRTEYYFNTQNAKRDQFLDTFQKLNNFNLNTKQLNADNVISYFELLDLKTPRHAKELTPDELVQAILKELKAAQKQEKADRKAAIQDLRKQGYTREQITKYLQNFSKKRAELKEQIKKVQAKYKTMVESQNDVSTKEFIKKCLEDLSDEAKADMEITVARCTKYCNKNANSSRNDIICSKTCSVILTKMNALGGRDKVSQHDAITIATEAAHYASEETRKPLEDIKRIIEIGLSSWKFCNRAFRRSCIVDGVRYYSYKQRQCGNENGRLGKFKLHAEFLDFCKKLGIQENDVTLKRVNNIAYVKHIINRIRTNIPERLKKWHTSFLIDSNATDNKYQRVFEELNRLFALKETYVALASKKQRDLERAKELNRKVFSENTKRLEKIVATILALLTVIQGTGLEFFKAVKESLELEKLVSTIQLMLLVKKLAMPDKSYIKL